ncbi:hypothetical protein SLEP1_g15089 [Rubroshorea leprosula]|uniref:Uncharacterized protein n=1 Tax=Rubroshorea leprosula TaxID=152421 RepID=A0AAV5ILA3_9ROSI|nr:hypothetical protein SLEP1_g15089 [Rubroshorea leprosula]
MASPYFDHCQKLFITPPQASSYVNPLYDEKATADSESIKSLAERIADFAEESKRLHEERLRRLEENLKVCKLNLPELKTPQPKSEVFMEDSKKCHAATSPGTLKQFCKSQNVTKMPIVSEGQTTLRSESNPMITVGGHESQLQCVVQSQQHHAALEATSTSMPPSHSKSAKTNTSNSPLTPGRHKPTQVKYPFKVVSLKRGVISSLGGQPSQIEQQRLQDLIANEVHKAIKKEVARFVPLQPDVNPSIQSMLPQQKHVCKPRLPQRFADSLPKATQVVHASQWQQPPGRQKFIWVEKKKHNAASQEANQNLVNAIVSPKTSAKCVPFKSNDSKAAKELNVSSKTISLGSETEDEETTGSDELKG